MRARGLLYAVAVLVMWTASVAVVAMWFVWPAVQGPGPATGTTVYLPVVGP